MATLNTPDRSRLIRLASQLPKGSTERKALLAKLKSGADRPARLMMGSTIASLKKAESMYEFDGSNDSEVLHHIGQALTNIAWVVREVGDPQASELAEVARAFEKMHR